MHEQKDENSRLKRIVAGLTLDREMLQDVIKRKLLGRRASVRLSTLFGRTGRLRSAGHVRLCALIVQLTITSPVGPIRPF